MPAAWQEASFHDLRVEGAFLVSAVREKGQTKFVRVKSLAGEPCLIQSDLRGKIKMISSGKASMRQQNGLIELTMAKGEEAVLYSGRKPKSFKIRAWQMKAEEANRWGVRN
jgi:hypothetical protein